MNDLLVGLLSALVSTNTPLAVSNLVQQKTGVVLEIADPNDPVERAYRKLMEEDDEAVVEISRWREENNNPGIKINEVQVSLLNNRIRQRAVPVRQSYEAFLEKNPRHTNARVAFAAFLDEVGEAADAEGQLEKAVQLDANSPAAMNNLANHFGHTGKLTNAFSLYERAIQLAPDEPLYHENLATIVFAFRREAMGHYHVDEQQVFAKALGLYRKALELDPKNFDRAVEWAKTYYGVKPAPSEDPEGRRRAELKLADEAMAAWQTAYDVANEGPEREGVRLHLARWQINSGRFDDARKNLAAVTNEMFLAGKKTLLKKLEAKASVR